MRVSPVSMRQVPLGHEICCASGGREYVLVVVSETSEISGPGAVGSEVKAGFDIAKTANPEHPVAHCVLLGPPGASILCEATTNSARGLSVRSITLAGCSESIFSVPLSVKAVGVSTKKLKLAPAYIADLFSSSI